MNISFDFHEKKYHIYAYVAQDCSFTEGDNRYYTTVALRFEGLKGREVYSGTAIAVPDDWNKKFDNHESRMKVIKTGVQLALKRAIDNFWEDQILSLKHLQFLDDYMKRGIDIRRKEIATAFWKEFLLRVEEL